MEKDAAEAVEGLAQELMREFRGVRARADLHPAQEFEDAYLWLDFEGADEDDFQDAFNFARARVDRLWREHDLHVTIKHRRRASNAEAEPEDEEGKHWD